MQSCTNEAQLPIDQRQQCGSNFEMSKQDVNTFFDYDKKLRNRNK